MHEEGWYCQILSCLSSIALFASGFVQVFVSCLNVIPLDLVHLVFQILAGIWCIFTGVLCIVSSWKHSSTMNSLGKNVSVFLCFVLEIMATGLLLIDEAGLKVSISHYLPYLKISGEKVRLEDLMILTGSGSFSLFMGVLILLSGLRRFQKKGLFGQDDSNVVFLSARWVFTEDSQMKLCEQNLIGSKKDLLNETSKTFEEQESKMDLTDSIHTPVNKLKQSNVGNLGSGTKLSDSNRSTYIRCYEVDDLPVENLCHPYEIGLENITPIRRKMRSTPRRTPLKICTPNPPNLIGNRRVLSFPLYPCDTFTLTKEDGDVQMNRSNRLTSFGASSTYFSSSSRMASWSSTPLSSNYHSALSLSPDNLNQSVASSKSSPNNSLNNSLT